MNDKPRIRKLPSRSSFVIAGCVLLAVASVMWLTKWDIAWHNGRGPGSLFVLVAVAAVGCFGLATAPR